VYIFIDAVKNKENFVFKYKLLNKIYIMGKCSVIGCSTTFRKKHEGGKHLCKYKNSTKEINEQLFLLKELS
jgi:hypothetical protein